LLSLQEDFHDFIYNYFIDIMQKKRVFISSVQSEFATERQALFDYLVNDALLGKFFDPFIFENVPAMTIMPTTVFLNEVERCDLYIGLFGQNYGYEDAEGISPTEREYDYATQLSKTRFVFLKNVSEERHVKEKALIKKAERTVVRKSFDTPEQLKIAVYATMVRYLEDNEFIRTTPFDATLNQQAKLEDLNEEKIRDFIGIANRKRAFPFNKDSDIETALTHLNLITEKRITNAALLLFGNRPQRFFITSEVKCAHFHGLKVAKPIPSYQVYKGDVFEMIEKAVDFVLSKINLYVGDRSKSVTVDVAYEIPKQAVTEAIVNAVCHRDYTSNGSVQIMLFADRLEVWNPGLLPYGLTVEKLYMPHISIPANPLIAEAMYLYGTIERMGTGTEELAKLCEKKGLKKPEFVQELDFRTIIYRPHIENTDKYPTSTRQVPDKYPTSTRQVETDTDIKEEVKVVIRLLSNELSRSEIQNLLGLKNREHFVLNYINPAIEQKFIELTYPDSPNHPKQKYRLTAKGIEQKITISNDEP